MDGTLLRRDGTIAERDQHAIRDVIRGGVHVTLCTGRVSTGAVGAARSLGLQTTMVCADGGVLACPRTAEKRSQTPMRFAAAARAAEVADEHELASFVFLHSEIHADRRGERWLEYVRTWTTELTVHERLVQAPSWRRPEDIAAVLAIGDRDRVEASASLLRDEHAAHVDLALWRVAGHDERWVMMVRPAGVHKGTGLAKLAAELGVAREDTCAVGDWLNDVPMFAWAGRSFAMGQSVEAVRASATDTLRATCDDGGGVAEAIERWLR
jgi:Cof subfamily protein (haloacid dehalogenase superfamily)